MAAAFDLKRFAYAHRGLWLKEGPPENSLAGFRAAAKAGLGIEFDLRPAADGTAMIFHDSLLDRMTAESGVFETRMSDVSRAIRLNGTDEHIPKFDDLLAIWPKTLPMLCELKIDGSTDPAAFARTIGDRLTAWPGLAAVMSFSEDAVRALPSPMMRGQLVLPTLQAGEERFTETVRKAIRDGINYLAVHHTDTARTAVLTDQAGIPFVVWTVRSEADLAVVRAHNPAIIFEHIDPALVAP